MTYKAKKAGKKVDGSPTLSAISQTNHFSQWRTTTNVFCRWNFPQWICAKELWTFKESAFLSKSLG